MKKMLLRLIPVLFLIGATGTLLIAATTANEAPAAKEEAQEDKKTQ